MSNKGENASEAQLPLNLSPDSLPHKKPRTSPPDPPTPSPPPTQITFNSYGTTGNIIAGGAISSSSISTSISPSLSLPPSPPKDDDLPHKRPPKGERGGGKKKQKEKEGWGTPRPSPRGRPPQGGRREEEGGGGGEGSIEEGGSPPSSPHPRDDIPLEELLKHGSGWAFPREQNGKMICIFRGCPQPLRAGTKKDYVAHLRLHNTMQHPPLYSMLRFAPPGGLLPASETGTEAPEESQAMFQVDGEWEEDDAEEDIEESMAGGGGREGGGAQAGGSRGGGEEVATGEEELHTPKLSQRGLQLRAQMMKYGLNIFRQDAEGRYLCFFHGCTMRMTTNFSRHIAKHEKKMDAISPELVHLLKEGANIEKQYIKGEKKKDGTPTSMALMSTSSHLIPPPSSHILSSSSSSSSISSRAVDALHRTDGIDINENSPTHLLTSHHHSHIPPSTPPPQLQYIQHIPPPPQHLSKITLPPPSHPLAHTHPPQQPMGYRTPPPPLHMPPSYPSSHSPTPTPLSSSSSSSSGEIRWVYRSPLPTPPPKRLSTSFVMEYPAESHSPSPKKPSPPSFPPAPPFSSSPRPPSKEWIDHSPPPPPHPPPLLTSSFEHALSLSTPDSALSSSSHSHPPDTNSYPPPPPPSMEKIAPHPHTHSHPHPPSVPQRATENQELGAVATSLLDLRKM